VSAAHLSGKIALITGAAGGIGAEIARKFQAEGASVFVADTNQVEGEKTAASIGATFVLLDVTSEESCRADAYQIPSNLRR
jgi:3(or 17)beta-hydroxysteroid dehydrogenase